MDDDEFRIVSARISNILVLFWFLVGLGNHQKTSLWLRSEEYYHRSIEKFRSIDEWHRARRHTTWEQWARMKPPKLTVVLTNYQGKRRQSNAAKFSPKWYHLEIQSWALDKDESHLGSVQCWIRSRMSGILAASTSGWWIIKILNATLASSGPNTSLSKSFLGASSSTQEGKNWYCSFDSKMVLTAH